MASTIPLVWTKHLKDPKKKEDFELSVRNSGIALSRLIEIVNEKLIGLDNSETSIKDFDDPSWAFKQAFKNGQRTGLKEIRSLLDFITRK